MEPDIPRELDWARAHMPRVQRALATLPDLREMRLACSLHLDLKTVPLVEGLLERGAQLFLTTCNPETVRDEVAAYLRARGASVEARRGMPADDYAAAIERALDWGPTHLCEVGADLTVALALRQRKQPQVRAGLEATGSGITRLAEVKLSYPIFNWDDLPVKEGLHNRHIVGLTTWQTFFARTRLTLHGKRVLVIGYGSVGRGVADAARAYGGTVCVAERDAARALEAAYAGWPVLPLDEAIALAEVIVTATGARGVVTARHLPLLRDGAFLLNVGHRADEIDVPALLAFPHAEALPFVEAVQIKGKTVYLFARGSMANLTAGEGDSLNAFDLTLAIMTAGIGHLAGAGAQAHPGLHPLPRAVWEPYLV
jgi:adenosylhomocysteinase